jgi:hypothetical protein
MKQKTVYILLAGFLLSVANLWLARCGRTKPTSSAGDVGFVPSDWDGETDYEKSSWRFEEP